MARLCVSLALLGLLVSAEFAREAAARNSGFTLSG